MPAGYEQYIETIPNVGPQYNVGLIVKDLVDAYGGVAMSRATPKNVAPLLEQLRALALNTKMQAIAPWIGLPHLMTPQWRGELQGFLDRVDEYRLAVVDADPDDRQAILDNVTIPLFFGTEGPEGLLRGADIRMPFTLSNQLKVSQEWRSQWMERVWKAVKETLGEYVPEIPPSGKWPPWARALAAITGVAFVVWTVRNLRGR